MTSFPAANPPCLKRLSSVGLNEPAQKRPPTPLEDKVVESEVRTRLGTSAHVLMMICLFFTQGHT